MKNSRGMWKRHYDRHINDEVVGQRGRKLRKEVADIFDGNGEVGHFCLQIHYQQQNLILQCQMCNGVCEEGRSKTRHFDMFHTGEELECPKCPKFVSMFTDTYVNVSMLCLDISCTQRVLVN